MIELQLIWRLKFNNTVARKVLRDNLMNFFCAGTVEKKQTPSIRRTENTN